MPEDEWAVAIVGTRRVTVLWAPGGGGSGHHPGPQWSHHRQRAGARGRFDRPPGSSQCRRAHPGGAGQRGRPGLSAREPPPGRPDHRAWCLGQRLRPGHPAGWDQLPAAQPHHLGPVAGGDHCRGRRDQRRADHRHPLPPNRGGMCLPCRATSMPRRARAPTA